MVSPRQHGSPGLGPPLSSPIPSVSTLKKWTLKKRTEILKAYPSLCGSPLEQPMRIRVYASEWPEKETSSEVHSTEKELQMESASLDAMRPRNRRTTPRPTAGRAERWPDGGGDEGQPGAIR